MNDALGQTMNAHLQLIRDYIRRQAEATERVAKALEDLVAEKKGD
jgi:hypothetical protein